MKALLKIIALIVVSNSVLAAASKMATPSTPIICPKEIYCSMGKRLGTCKIVGNNLEQWYEEIAVIGDAEGSVTKGTHHFNYAMTSWQSGNGSYAFCYYDNLFIYAKSSRIEAAPGKKTAWEIIGEDANCESDNPAVCPFNLIPVITIKTNSENFNNITVSAGGVGILTTWFGPGAGYIEELTIR